MPFDIDKRGITIYQWTLIMAPNGLLEKPPAGRWDGPRLADALEHRVVRDLYRHLQAMEYSQRYIAALTEQSQGEISDFMENGSERGTRVRSYDLLVQIAEGLGIPREGMGLGYGRRHEPEDLTGPMDAGGAAASPQHREPASAVTRPRPAGRLRRTAKRRRAHRTRLAARWTPVEAVPVVVARGRPAVPHRDRGHPDGRQACPDIRNDALRNRRDTTNGRLKSVPHRAAAYQ
jgi:hypothetical protein